MDVKILPARLHGSIGAIPSKSQAHRALICAALADRPTRIACQGASEDIAATVDCLTALGARIQHETGGYIVRPLQQAGQNGEVSLPCRESGSTFRFLLPIVGALSQKAAFTPQGRLPKRPLSPLYEELVSHGCTLSPPGSVPFQVAGQLSAGRYSLDAGVSSQFISGLLFALPLLAGKSEIHLTGWAESVPYIELTTAMLAAFGLQLGFDGKVFTIPGQQQYRSPTTVEVEGDWSNAAFWLCAGAIGAGSITCTGLDSCSRQGDRTIVEILQRLGARLEMDGDRITASGGELQGAEIDARDIPDLVPILAVAGATATGATVIRNASRLRAKESDRLAAITAVLRGLGAQVNEQEDSLRIQGGRLNGGEVSAWGDHRIAMAATIAATVCAEPVTIRDAEAINKSYPGFFADLQQLGGSMQIVET